MPIANGFCSIKILDESMYDFRQNMHNGVFLEHSICLRGNFFSDLHNSKCWSKVL